MYAQAFPTSSSDELHDDDSGGGGGEVSSSTPAKSPIVITPPVELQSQAAGLGKRPNNIGQPVQRRQLQQHPHHQQLLFQQRGPEILVPISAQVAGPIDQFGQQVPFLPVLDIPDLPLSNLKDHLRNTILRRMKPDKPDKPDIQAQIDQAEFDHTMKQIHEF